MAPVCSADRSSYRLGAGEPEIEALKKVLPARPGLVSSEAHRKEYDAELAVPRQL